MMMMMFDDDKGAAFLGKSTYLHKMVAGAAQAADQPAETETVPPRLWLDHARASMQARERVCEVQHRNVPRRPPFVADPNNFI